MGRGMTILLLPNRRRFGVMVVPLLRSGVVTAAAAAATGTRRATSLVLWYLMEVLAGLGLGAAEWGVLFWVLLFWGSLLLFDVEHPVSLGVERLRDDGFGVWIYRRALMN